MIARDTDNAMWTRHDSWNLYEKDSGDAIIINPAHRSAYTAQNNMSYRAGVAEHFHNTS